MCALTPLLLVGFVVGTAVSSLTGSDLAGWVAALAAVAVAAAVRRVRGRSATCSGSGLTCRADRTGGAEPTQTLQR